MKKHLILNSENITRLSKNIVKSLKSDGINASHNQILNSFANSLGFPNLYAAQIQDFMQERKEENQYIVEVKLKAKTINYYDSNEEYEVFEKLYFLFSDFENRNFNFHLMVEYVSLFDVDLSHSSKKMFENFIQKRNNDTPIEIFDFLNLILVDANRKKEFFKNQNDIEEFDQIFINEMDHVGEIKLEDEAGAITDFKILKASPENIQFMIDNKMIDARFIA